ncbi:uracil-DNA glycosylase family protein [Paracoccus sp. MKU1]|uniref:uracil-DNA glycosylase family protein n=1 Tax=Paracoccus sp. MKU1 TaxID=1745182 RepID=UPI00210143DD|nr:uracil-DNA glycosylase family protein [Paracoccus sp. MKU1]
MLPGKGCRQARMMVVGERPGDNAGLAGGPFVGLMGCLFDQTLAEAGIPSDQIFVTNAAKPFQFEPLGKHRRLHHSPNADEIARYGTLRQWVQGWG